MQDQGGWLWFVIDVGFVLMLAAALLYGMSRWHQRTPAAKAAGDQATRKLYGKDDPASPPLQPTAEGERPTEDMLAQASLGGTRGSPELPDARMTPQRAKKM